MRTNPSSKRLQEVLLCTPTPRSHWGTTAAKAMKEMDSSSCSVQGANDSQILCLAAPPLKSPRHEPWCLQLQTEVGYFGGNPAGNGMLRSNLLHVLRYNKASGKALPDFRADMSSA